MAILVFKTNLRAQHKGAMTNMPLANSTFAESPFCLEDTMRRGFITKLKIVEMTPDYCRKEANNLMRQLHPEIDWHLHCVHHIDGNPFNNSLDNLQIMKQAEHIKHHNIKLISGKKIKTELPKLTYLYKNGNQTDRYGIGNRWHRCRQIVKVFYNHKKDFTTIVTKRIF